MKMLKLALIGFMALIITGIILSAINYYYFDWTSYINPFEGTYKTIATISGSGQEKLSQEYDLFQINHDLQKRNNYNSNFYHESYLVISRNYKQVEYIIRLEKLKSASGTFTHIDYNIRNLEYGVSHKLANGELPSTPNYYIKQNISQMINEMPINIEQKEELQSKVKVISATSLRGF